MDARWPGFSSDEKSYVRKILSGSMGNNISNFAPVRKSRIVPMVAPGSGILLNNAAPSTDGLFFLHFPKEIFHFFSGLFAFYLFI